MYYKTQKNPLKKYFNALKIINNALKKLIVFIFYKFITNFKYLTID